MGRTANWSVIDSSRYEVQRAHVLEQLDRLLESPYFRNSKRYPTLLSHVVEKTLDGHIEDLKERSIGHEIFQKSADYDTNNDNIVRITAGEIRKRLAQYYQESAHEEELRIDLPPGAYIPVFHWLKGKDAVLDTECPEVFETPTEPSRPAETEIHSVTGEEKSMSESSEISGLGSGTAHGQWNRRWLLVGSVCLFVLTIAVSFVRFLTSRTESEDPFWSQTFAVQPGTLFCVPVMHADPQAAGSAGVSDKAVVPGMTLTQDDETMNRVALADAIALSRLVSALHIHARQYSVKGDKFTHLADLRASPAVLIGAFDNDWTLRLTSSLRFYFEKNPLTGMLYIRDREKDGFEGWKLDGRIENTNVVTDYAIVARFADRTTEQPVVIAAGLGEYGTLAAAEILTNPQYLTLLTDQLHSEKRQSNFEAVLITQVINGSNGPPHVLAVYTW